MQAIVVALFSIGVLYVLWHVRGWLITQFAELKRYVKEDETFNKEFRNGNK